MRANYKLQRLFVDQALAEGLTVTPSPPQAHYLTNVLRMQSGAEILLFNGRDGEWSDRLAQESKKVVHLVLGERTRAQTPTADLLFCFAPLKAGRLDWLVQRATEMGAGIIQPVVTRHTQVRDPGFDRIRANVIEAAEQCGVLSVRIMKIPSSRSIAPKLSSRSACKLVKMRSGRESSTSHI